MSSKLEVFNLALGALLLTRQLSDCETDPSSEARVLRTNWNISLKKVLQDLDLDSTATTVPLQLVAKEVTPGWLFAYQYPPNCALFRRLVRSCNEDGYYDARRIHKDTRSTQIPRQIANWQNQKVIFSNHHQAWVEYIPFDNTFALSLLNASAVLALAYELAILSSPLIAGKGAGPLRKELRQQYISEKAQAQEQDKMENATFDEDVVMSEFVEARLS